MGDGCEWHVEGGAADGQAREQKDLVVGADLKVSVCGLAQAASENDCACGLLESARVCFSSLCNHHHGSLHKSLSSHLI